MGFFYLKWKMYEEGSYLEVTRKLFVMAIKNGAKLEEELTCRFKIEMRNLTNFDPSTRKFQKFTL